MSNIKRLFTKSSRPKEKDIWFRIPFKHLDEPDFIMVNTFLFPDHAIITDTVGYLEKGH